MPDLRLSEMEKKDFSTPSTGPKAPKYPYGLKITLGPEELEKLGISELPQVDSFVNFEAKAKKAQESPASKYNFLVKHLNQWQNTASQFFSLKHWDECADPSLKIEDYLKQGLQKLLI